MPSGVYLSEEWIKDNQDQVFKLARVGCTLRDIGSVLGISHSSVDYNFPRELEKGRAELRCSLRRSQVSLAIQDKNPTMQIWLGKQLLDQKDSRHQVEHSGGIIIEKVNFGDYDAEKDSDT